MDFFHKFFFFNPSGNKTDFYCSAECIDFITWYKKEGVVVDGTMLHTNILLNPVSAKIENRNPSNLIRQIVNGNPENANNIALDGLLLKSTVQYVHEDGSIKKYTAWLNPDNIAFYYSMLPKTTEVHFKSGNSIIVCNDPVEFFKNLREHNTKYKERKREKYGKKN